MICACNECLVAMDSQYSRISGCGEKYEVQFGFGEVEREYQWAATSEEQPGYMLSY